MLHTISEIQAESGSIWVEPVQDGKRDLILLVALSGYDVPDAPDRVVVWLTSRQTTELIKQLSIACRG